MKIIVIIIAAIVAIALLVYAYFGGFKKVSVTTSSMGGETVVYEEITGDYKQSGAVMDKVYYSLRDTDNIETFKGFGIYYDNPQTTEKSKLRSEAGCIIEPGDIDKVNLISGEFKVKALPEKEYLVTEFPYKGKMSVVFGIMKVYPAMNKYAEKNNLSAEGPVTEIYDVPNKKIIYRKEI